MANQFGSSTFPFVLGVSITNTSVRNVSQTFLSQTVALESIFRAAADRIFFFGAYPGPLGGPTGEIGQFADTNFKYADVSQTFLNQVSGLNQQIDVIQYLGYTERFITEDLLDRFFDRFSTDPASSRAGIITTENASNAFSWNDHDGDVAFEALQRVFPLVDVIGFSETLLNTPEAEDLFDTIFATGQSVDTNGTDLGESPSQTFIRQSVSFSVEGGPSCPEKEYAPFIGSSDSGDYEPVPETPPVLGDTTLTLFYPRFVSTLILPLKNPEFGNADVIRFTKIDRRTRGGDRKFFSDPDWGRTQTFELTISNICETNVTIDEIIEFLNESLGQEIRLLDWEGRLWAGIIVVPETEITPQVSGHRVRIVFEGKLNKPPEIVANSVKTSTNLNIAWIDSTVATWQTEDNSTGATGEVVGNNIPVNWASAAGGKVSLVLPQRLTNLDLRGNALDSFDFVVTEGDESAMDAMVDLRVSVNDLTTLNTYEWPSLVNLFVENNSLTTFVTQPWPDIEELHFHSNRITGFTPYPWLNLRTLRADRNNMSGFDVKTEAWPNIERLDVSYNGIRSFESQDTWTKIRFLLAAVGDTTKPFQGPFTTHPEWELLEELAFTYQSYNGSIATYPEWTALEVLAVEKNQGLTACEIQTTWASIRYVNYLDNKFEATTIDAALINLDIINNSNGYIDYRTNPGSPDASRSPAAATAKANLVSRGWAVLS